jgi:organic radical activating enzyme
MPLPTAPDTLIVSEISPSTVVGDGPLAGWRCAMIRLGGCNLACTWCDVPYAWDGSHSDLTIELPVRLVRNVVEEALAADPRLVLITGGEPLLQQRHAGWSALLRSLHERGVETELHTNGTLAPTAETAELVHRFVVSPKLSHSGEPTWTRLRPEALEAWVDLARAGKVAFSFVVRDRTDVRTVATLAAVHAVPQNLIWISPEGATCTRVLDVTADVAARTVEHGFNLATRVGVLVSGGRVAVA